MQQGARATQKDVQTGAGRTVGRGRDVGLRSSTEAASRGNDTSSQVTERLEKGEITMADISQFVDKDYEQKEFNELAEAPVDAIQGVSKGDAEKLQQAFNVKTVRDLAENKFVRIAQAIVTLSGTH